MLTVGYQELKEMVVSVIKAGRTPMIWGAPGIGKSSLAEDVKNELKRDKLIVIESCLFSPSDLFVNIPENGVIKEYVYNIPKNSVVLIDDITLAEEFQMKSILKMVFEKRIGNVPLTDVDFIMTGNRLKDLTGVNEMISTLKNRVVQFELKPKFEDWLVWADGKIRNEIISFLFAHPDQFFHEPMEGKDSWPTPRSWHIFSDVINNLSSEEKDKLDLDKVHLIGCGTIGNETSTHFYNFMKYRYNFSPKKSLETGSIGEGDRMELYSRILSLAEYVINNQLSKSEGENLNKIYKNLSGEYKSLFFKRLIKRKGGSLDLSVVLKLMREHNLDFCDFIDDINREIKKDSKDGKSK